MKFVKKITEKVCMKIFFMKITQIRINEGKGKVR